MIVYVQKRFLVFMKNKALTKSSLMEQVWSPDKTRSRHLRENQCHITYYPEEKHSNSWNCSRATINKKERRYSITFARNSRKKGTPSITILSGSQSLALPISQRIIFASLLRGFWPSVSFFLVWNRLFYWIWNPRVQKAPERWPIIFLTNFLLMRGLEGITPNFQKEGLSK